jgi:hypothetical protein
VSEPSSIPVRVLTIGPATDVNVPAMLAAPLPYTLAMLRASCLPSTGVANV